MASDTGSMFYLPKNPNPTGIGVTNHYYSRVTPTSDGKISAAVHIANQGSQELNYRFTNAGSDWWVPSKSYFRIRLRCKQRRARTFGEGEDASTSNHGSSYCYGPHIKTDADRDKDARGMRLAGGDPNKMEALFQQMVLPPNDPAHNDETERQIEQALGRIRPARGMCSAMFNQASMKIGDTIVSKISDDYLHQIDIFKKRSSESKAFLNGSGNFNGFYAGNDDFHPASATIASKEGLPDPNRTDGVFVNATLRTFGGLMPTKQYFSAANAQAINLLEPTITDGYVLYKEELRQGREEHDLSHLLNGLAAPLNAGFLTDWNQTMQPILDLVAADEIVRANPIPSPAPGSVTPLPNPTSSELQIQVYLVTNPQQHNRAHLYFGLWHCGLKTFVNVPKTAMEPFLKAVRGLFQPNEVFTEADESAYIYLSRSQTTPGQAYVNPTPTSIATKPPRFSVRARVNFFEATTTGPETGSYMSYVDNNGQQSGGVSVPLDFTEGGCYLDIVDQKLWDAHISDGKSNPITSTSFTQLTTATPASRTVFPNIVPAGATAIPIGNLFSIFQLNATGEWKANPSGINDYTLNLTDKKYDVQSNQAIVGPAATTDQFDMLPAAYANQMNSGDYAQIYRGSGSTTTVSRLVAGQVKFAIQNIEPGAPNPNGEQQFYNNYGADTRLRAMTMDMSSGYCEVMYQPPLSIFDYPRALPPATYTLQLRTKAGNFLPDMIDWEQFRFSTTYGSRPSQEWVDKICGFNGGTQSGHALLDWGIEEIYFYPAIVEGPFQPNSQFTLDLRETYCTAQQLTQGAGVQTQNFDVDAKTDIVAFAFQGTTKHLHGSNGEFRCGLRPIQLASGTPQGAGNFKYPPGALPCGAEVRGLSNWYVSYDSKQYPREYSQQEIEPNLLGSTSLFDEKTLQTFGYDKGGGYAKCNDAAQIFITQRWFDTVSQNGTHYMSSGAETVQDWLAAGAYYYMTWPRKYSQNATRLMVTFQQNDTTNPDVKQYLGADFPEEGEHDGESVSKSNCNLLLFHQAPKAFLISTVDGRVKMIETPLNTNAEFRSVGS